MKGNGVDRDLLYFGVALAAGAALGLPAAAMADAPRAAPADAGGATAVDVFGNRYDLNAPEYADPNLVDVDGFQVRVGVGPAGTLPPPDASVLQGSTGTTTPPVSNLVTPASASSETVFMPDSRARVDPTTIWPAKSTVYIARFDQGVAIPGTKCTGWMLSHSYVGTAGHCVWQAGSWKFNQYGPAVVIPAFNGTGNKPYGSCSTVNEFVPVDWFSGSSEADIGKLRLGCSVGSQTGYPTLLGTSNPGSFFHGNHGYSYLYQQNLNGLTEQYEYYSDGFLSNGGGPFITSQIDLDDGASGGPLFWNSTGCSYCVIGENIYEQPSYNGHLGLGPAQFSFIANGNW